jgi:hypothetical protein
MGSGMSAPNGAARPPGNFARATRGLARSPAGLERGRPVAFGVQRAPQPGCGAERGRIWRGAWRGRGPAASLAKFFGCSGKSGPNVGKRRLSAKAHGILSSWEAFAKPRIRAAPRGSFPFPRRGGGGPLAVCHTAGPWPGRGSEELGGLWAPLFGPCGRPPWKPRGSARSRHEALSRAG